MAAFDIKNLFKQKLGDKNITLDNPLILAIQKGLTKKRDRIDSVSESVIVVLLPKKSTNSRMFFDKERYSALRRLPNCCRRI